MNVVYFKEENHIYTSDTQDYTSVSGLYKPYFKPFDADKVSVKKAFKDFDNANYLTCKKKLSYDHVDFIKLLKKETDLDVKDLLREAQVFRDTWTAKSQKGTDFHSSQEELDHKNGFRINPFTNKKSEIIKWDIRPGYENQSCPGALMDLPDGYIPEWLIKSDIHLIAGQADQGFIETIDGVRYIDIDDWKTDETILMKPSFFHPKKGLAKMNYPINHIYETNYWKYAMKISTYAKMLENEGFVIRNLAFTHVVINDNLEILEQTRYILPYKDFEAQLIMDLHIS